VSVVITKKKKQRPTTIDPDRLYTFEELGEVSGLGPRKVRREVEDGRMGFIQVSPERGRMIEGQQYLDWKDAHRRTPRVEA
jgi:hypothetical protein